MPMGQRSAQNGLPGAFGLDVQSVGLNLRLGPGTLELNAAWRLARERTFYEAYFSPAQANAKVIDNLILFHPLL